eukprot:TRINITY_DN16974_c0_g1_i2.p1 TRINITY_DN16974_c0_g1~~TRINITY_DN16974_c0_g1_i2.p1  ORF type:complete len:229 (+),score=34.18 TRINITY_DN16974_c0_g1_i2:39-725(+)
MEGKEKQQGAQGEQSSGSETLTRILAAKSLFGRLGLEIGAISPSEVRKTYRAVAIKVHPDKCADPQATECFQLLSEAFDVLSNPRTQNEYLDSLSSRSTGGGGNGGQRKQKRRKGQRWWQARSWEEIDRRMRMQEAAEKAMRQTFISGKSSKYAERKVFQSLRQAESSCQDLDERAGMSENELWRAKPVPDPDEPGMQIVPEPLDLVQATQKLGEIISHLRATYLYWL